MAHAAGSPVALARLLNGSSVLFRSYDMAGPERDGPRSGGGDDAVSWLRRAGRASGKYAAGGSIGMSFGLKLHPLYMTTNSSSYAAARLPRVPGMPAAHESEWMRTERFSRGFSGVGMYTDTSLTSLDSAKARKKAAVDRALVRKDQRGRLQIRLAEQLVAENLQRRLNRERERKVRRRREKASITIQCFFRRMLAVMHLEASHPLLCARCRALVCTSCLPR